MNYDGMVSRIQEILRALPNMQVTPAQLLKAVEGVKAILDVIEMKNELISLTNKLLTKQN